MIKNPTNVKIMSNKIYLYLLLCFSFMVSCGKMYDNIDKYSGETVYPGKFDTIIGRIGYERVEINLMKAGRIPASQIKLGKAMKTVVEYDDKQIVIDTLASWLNIKDLKMSKLYRFKVYAIDEHGNKSVPQQIALIPYTASDLAGLVVQSPKVLVSPAAAVLSWPSGLSSILLNYYGLKYSFKDKNGVTRTGERNKDPRIFMSNLNAGAPANIDITYKIIPKVNGVLILDTLAFVQKTQINMPTGSTPFAPVEQSILTANGLTNFTADGVASVSKLTFPVHTGTLQDIFYFSGLKELDLTGGSIFQMPTNSYNNNGATDVIGGGPLVPFGRKMGDMSAANAQYLVDLLEVGSLTKVKYVVNSMGIDKLLAPYVSSGVVELVGKPDEALVPLQPYLLEGRIQDGAWELNVEAPATSPPAGVGLENVMKVIVKKKNGTLVIQLPKEYEFDVVQYPYLKFKVYGPAKTTVSGGYSAFQRIWMRFMNNLWAFGSESSNGQQYWDYPADTYKLSDDQLQTWVDMSISLANSAGKHNRVILINLGGEPNMDFAPASDIIYYFANIRFSKNP